VVFEQEYRNRINRVIKTIIRHPGDDWTTQTLAGLAGISAFHFHRIFHALTGETMFAFLQRRRLLRAIELMHEGRFTLTEIALECGFDSGSSLSRAFRKHFHCSPSQYHKKYPPLLLPPLRPRADRKNTMQVTIREMRPRTALIVERQGMIEQNFNLAAAAAFRALTSEIKRVNGWPAIRECFGMCPDEASMVPDAQARYQAGFFYEGEWPALSDEVQHITIPGGRWAVSLHQGAYETLWQSWNRLYRDWLPASGCVKRDVAPFEIYLNDKKQVPPEELRTEIWIPIE
jgi:AraC family transcriptional regulator